jgi:hypothetical protein
MLVGVPDHLSKNPQEIHIIKGPIDGAMDTVKN